MLVTLVAAATLFSVGSRNSSYIALKKNKNRKTASNEVTFKGVYPRPKFSLGCCAPVFTLTSFSQGKGHQGVV